MKTYIVKKKCAWGKWSAAEGDTVTSDQLPPEVIAHLLSEKAIEVVEVPATPTS
jgi:hypothetical protein